MQNAQDTGMGSPPGQTTGAPRGIKDTVGGLVSDAKEQFVEGAKARAVGAVEERKTSAAQGLGTVADALREAAHKLEDGETGPLGSYAESAAEQVEKVARYIREKDLAGLTRDTETFARRHPEVFLGGAFLAGLLAARFLKSSGRRSAGGDAPDYQGGFSEAGYRDGGYSQEPFNPPHITRAGGQ